MSLIIKIIITLACAYGAYKYRIEAKYCYGKEKAWLILLFLGLLAASVYFGIAIYGELMG